MRLQKFIFLAVIAMALVVFGYTLADDAFFAALAFGGLAWLMLMPYHATLSVTLAIATFSTALIMPFFPGRPFVWEAAALLGWTGCVLVFSFRQYRDEMWDSIHEHKWLLFGVAGAGADPQGADGIHDQCAALCCRHALDRSTPCKQVIISFGACSLFIFTARRVYIDAEVFKVVSSGDS